MLSVFLQYFFHWFYNVPCIFFFFLYCTRNTRAHTRTIILLYIYQLFFLPEKFHTLALEGVPIFGLHNRSAAYRFVTLVDVSPLLLLEFILLLLFF